jgi:hypothetical protein
MGEGERARRADPLADVDWETIFARASAFAGTFVPDQDIDDVVTEGIASFYEGTVTYDPEIDHDLPRRVVEVGRDAIRAERLKVQRWASGDSRAGVGIAPHDESLPDPEQAERIAALDPAGLARELEAAGRTLEGERAKGRALLERLRNGEFPAVAVGVPAQNEPRTRSGFRTRSGLRRSASTHGGRRPTLLWMLAAALAMLGAVVFVERRELVARFRLQPPPSSSPHGPQ